MRHLHFIYLEKELQVCDILELNKFQKNDVSGKVFFCDLNILRSLHGVSLVKVQCVGLVLEDSQLKSTVISIVLTLIT